MTQLWALTVDSGWSPVGPMLWKGGSVRQTRWDVITPCNLEEIHWAAHSQDESILLVPSLSIATKLHCLQKPKKRGSENQFCLVGVPQGLVLGPSQISYSPGAMFFPQGVAPQTDSQTAHPVLYGPGAASQHTTLLRSSWVERELSGVYAEGSACIWLSVFLSDTLPCHLILSHFPSISQSEA